MSIDFVVLLMTSAPYPLVAVLQRILSAHEHTVLPRSRTRSHYTIQKCVTAKRALEAEHALNFGVSMRDCYCSHSRNTPPSLPH